MALTAYTGRIGVELSRPMDCQSRASIRTNVSLRRARKLSTSSSSRLIARLHPLQDTASSRHASSSANDVIAPHDGHSAISSATVLVRANDKEEFALLLPFVRIVGEHVLHDAINC